MEPYWMDLFVKYLDQGELLKNKKEAKKIAAKAENYQYEDGVLFKRGKSMSWLQCVGPKEAKKIAAKGKNYQYKDRVLFKREKSMSWLQCVGPKEAAYIVQEIYRGICGIHKWATTLANKIFQQGYY